MWLHSEQLHLLSGVLLISENPLGLERTETLELRDHILFWRTRSALLSTLLIF